ncbi:MAG: VWA domain-containing protein [Spirochaetaceae bacterium]|jgi:Ca-activated chloride channel family protein|nr:VWA domain-containing protein [Spirochaetaceae bacterium]
MTFENPAFFSLLYALIPVIILMILNYKRRFTRIYSLLAPVTTIFYDESGAKKTSAFPSKTELTVRYAASSLFFIVFFICACIALAGPRFGIRFVRELRQGVDLVLAFDLSRSMNAKDAAPLPMETMRAAGAGLSASRLERSIYTARNLVKTLISENGVLKNLRLGIALGKGESVLAVPLTDDTETIFSLFDSLSSLAITSRGTNLEKILDAAGGAFQDSFPSARAVILFSDGEALSGSLPAAVDRLREREIKLFTVGAGSAYGAPVPDEPSSESGASAGERHPPVTSRLRRDVLSAAAERTGGEFIDGNAEAAAALAGLITLGGMAAGDEGVWTFREESGSQWHLFVIAAFAALVLSRLCSLKPRVINRPPVI